MSLSTSSFKSGEKRKGASPWHRVQERARLDLGQRGERKRRKSF